MYIDAGWIINGGHSHLLGLLGDQCLPDRSPPSEGYFSDTVIAMPTSFSLFSACCVFPSLPFQPVRFYLIRCIMLEFLYYVRVSARAGVCWTSATVEVW